MSPVLARSLIIGTSYRTETERSLLVQEMSSNIGGHNDDRISEIHAATLGICKLTILENL